MNEEEFKLIEYRALCNTWRVFGSLYKQVGNQTNDQIWEQVYDQVTVSVIYPVLNNIVFVLLENDLE